MAYISADCDKALDVYSLEKIDMKLSETANM